MSSPIEVVGYLVESGLGLYPVLQTLHLSRRKWKRKSVGPTSGRRVEGQRRRRLLPQRDGPRRHPPLLASGEREQLRDSRRRCHDLTPAFCCRP